MAGMPGRSHRVAWMPELSLGWAVHSDPDLAEIPIAFLPVTGAKVQRLQERRLGLRFKPCTATARRLRKRGMGVGVGPPKFDGRQAERAAAHRVCPLGSGTVPKCSRQMMPTDSQHSRA